MENIAIQLQGVSKSFKKKQVLKESNLVLNYGHSYGLLGKNGAGKSTLINLIIGLTIPTTGEINLENDPVHQLPSDKKMKWGALTEKLPLQDELSGWEQMWMVGLFYGIPKKELKTRIESLFEYFFDDRDSIKKRTSTYSTGMKKKLGLMAALLHNPSILLLDEPFSGIDPVSASRMNLFFKEWMNENRLLLISSHKIDQIEKIVDHVIVIDKNSIVYDGSTDDFTGQGLSNMEDKLYEMLQGNEKTLDTVSWLV